MIICPYCTSTIPDAVLILNDRIEKIQKNTSKITLDFLGGLLYNTKCLICRCDGIGRRSGLKIHR